MKKRNRQAKRDNEGFSLIELLVAVVIVAVVVVPLLRGFISSYRVNSKSRSVLRATTLAQNEMETFEKEKIADLTDPAKFDYTYTLDDATGIYSFLREDVKLDSASAVSYDVEITLNPMRQGDETDGTAEKYKTVNEDTLLVMNTISAIDSGTYIQPVRTATGEVGQDQVVYGEFVTNLVDDNAIKAIWTEDKFATDLKRDIYLEVEKGADGVTRARVIYDYVCETNGVVKPSLSSNTDGAGHIRKESIVYDNSQMLDEEGNRVELKCLYLFYAPRYGLALSNPDTIHIKNEQGLPVEFYVIRQDILQEGPNELWVTPLDYRTKLEITDVLEDGKTRGSYRTNLNVDETPAEGVGQQIEVSLKDQTGVSYTDPDAKTKTGLLPLKESKAKDRIYVMQVNVYAKGGHAAGERPLATLDGTKLE